MTERCSICNGTGQVLESKGLKLKGEVCDCKIVQVWGNYMGDLIKDAKSISPYTKILVDNILESYRYLEEHTKKKTPKHLYMFDTPLDNKSKEKDMRFSNIYKSIFLLYLVRTKEYLSYKHYDIMKFIDMYFGVQTSNGELEQNFYTFSEGTFLIECNVLIANKYAFDTIRHFIECYKDRNIIIYASTRYKESLAIKTKDQSSGKYNIQELDKSLKDVITKEYNSFMNVLDFANGNPFIRI